MFTKNDEMVSILTQKDILQKQNLKQWVAQQKLPENQPVSLLLTLQEHQNTWQIDSTCDLLAERLAINEIVDKTHYSYIPTPGLQDAQIILPLEDYKNNVPEDYQRQLAFLIRKSKTLLILDVDPWITKKINEKENRKFWASQTLQQFPQDATHLQVIRGFTHIHEAVNYKNIPTWKKLNVSPDAIEILQNERINPYWETPTHIYAWNETTISDEELKKNLIRLEAIIYKQIRITPKIYDNVGQIHQNKDVIQINVNEQKDVKEIRQLWKDFVRKCVKEYHSDIHITPNRQGALNIASRKDGHTVPHFIIPPQLTPVMYKEIMRGTGLDALKDTTMPKDARGSLQNDNELQRSIDFRYSLKPGPPPECNPKIVIRILDPTKVKKSVFKLTTQFPEDKQHWERIMRINNGMILVVGPTGSGKSVTLYAMLHSFHQKDPGLIFETIEDPIEFIIGGWINQSSVNTEKNASWQQLIRQCLRQDVDGLLIGEIRDRESAELANEFAASGHILFSTLHTESSRHVPLRLKEMEVNTANLAHTLKVTIAQRLIALSCPNCQRPLNQEEREIAIQAGCPTHILDKLIQNDGCPHCNHNGVNTRTAIQEFSFFETEEERKLIKDPDPHTTDKIMREKGLQSISDKAWILGERQITPLSEILDVINNI